MISPFYSYFCNFFKSSIVVLSLYSNLVLSLTVMFGRGAELSWQGRPLRPTEDTLRVAVNKVVCGGNEAFFAACQLSQAQECVIARDAVGVRCYKNWVSECQPGEVNHNKKCYKLIVPSVRHALEGFSHGEALRDCRQRGAQLLDITSQVINVIIILSGNSP